MRLEELPYPPLDEDPVTGLPSPPPDWSELIFWIAFTALLIYLGYKLF